MASLDDLKKRRPVRGCHGKSLQRLAIAVVLGLAVLFAVSGKGFGYTTTSTSFGSSVSHDIPLMNPQAITMDSVEIFFQVPPQSPVGIVLLFHGCEHDAMHWFTLPEERAIVKFLLSQGYAAISFSSQDREGSRCWDASFPASQNADAVRVSQAFPRALEKALGSDNKVKHLPLYGIGASSGGIFVTILHQLIPFRGLEIIVSPGNAKALTWAQEQSQIKPRIAFVYMPKDTSFAGFRQVSQQVQRLGGLAVVTFACESKPVSAAWLSESIDSLSLQQANEVVEHLVEMSIIDRETGMLLYRPGQALGSILSEVLDGVDEIIIDSLNEAFNVAYGEHEMTREHIEEVWSFFTDNGNANRD
jgi:poly(3-hydroxybutyrate) depolymerase